MRWFADAIPRKGVVAALVAACSRGNEPRDCWRGDKPRDPWRGDKPRDYRFMCMVAFAFCLLPWGGAEGAEVKLIPRAEPSTVTIGTPFRYAVEIDAPEEVELVVPLLGERFGDFHVVDFGDEPPRRERGRLIATRWFTLVSYTTGELLVPPFQIKYRLPGEELRHAEAEEVLVIVDSLLAKSPGAEDIRDIAPPEAVPRDWTPLLLVAGGVLALLAAGAGLYFLLNRPRRVAAAAPAPAHEIALEALRKLRRRRLLEQGAFEEYYVALSAIIRAYVENRFHLRAPEMTTEEFLAEIQRDRRLTADHRSLLGTFLAESDLVKFARHHPTLEDAERAHDAARRFVDESRLGPAVEEGRRAAA